MLLKRKPKKVSSVDDKPRPSSGGVFVLNEETGKSYPVLPLQEVVYGILSLAQALAERKFYPYQVQFGYRFVESLLLRDGATITALLSRQSGKTDVLASCITALLIILPELAKQYPNDYRLNLTDNEGRYRGFRDGVKIGIYAPKLSQSEIMYERVKLYIDTKTARRVLSEQGLTIMVSNGDTLRVSHGSRLLCQTASDKAKIEGETHHLLVLEEAQDISEQKIKKSLSPMVAATRGTTVMIGTASTQKCVFWEMIKQNERAHLAGFRRNNFIYTWKVCARYNSLYLDHVLSEQIKLGTNSDEFRMSYDVEWLFERGMFMSQDLLLGPKVALTNGELFSTTLKPNAKLGQEYSVVVGIDWGKQHDSTVLTLMAVNWLFPVQTIQDTNAKGTFSVELFQKHVLGWHEWQGDNYEYQFNEVVAVIRSWKPYIRRVVTDSSGCGEPIFDRLVATLAMDDIEVAPLVFTPGSKSDLYKALYAEMCGYRLTFPADKMLRSTNEFRKFTNQMLDLTKKYKEGRMIVAHPDEKHAHDDYPDSLALANWAAMTRPADAEVDFSDTNFMFRSN